MDDGKHHIFRLFAYARALKLSKQLDAAEAVRSHGVEALYALNAKKIDDDVSLKHVRDHVRMGFKVAAAYGVDADDDAVEPKKSEVSNSTLSTVPFDSLDVRKETKRALKEVFGYTFMSKAQAECIPVALQGQDCFVKARTGNGKTLGFLIPAFEHLTVGKVSVVVLVHTHSLEDQTLEQATKLLKFRSDIRVGTTRQSASRLCSCEVIIATPGTLKKYLGDAAFALRFSSVQVAVLDEADQLLSSFSNDVKAILSACPTRTQTLMFSATLQAATQKMLPSILRPDYKLVDTVPEGESASNAQVEQQALVVPPEAIFQSLFDTILQAKSSNKASKVMVFLPTVRLVQTLFELFKSLGLTDIYEMHSKVSDGQRRVAVEAFSSMGRGQVMLASDMSARGVDYPDVTHVLQIGPVNQTEGRLSDYHHRIGRTGRGGKLGTAIAILGTDEVKYLAAIEKEIGLELERIPSVPKSHVTVHIGLDAYSQKLGSMTYKSIVGAYKSTLKVLGWNDKALFMAMDKRFLASGLGLLTRPEYTEKELRKMNIPRSALE
jgi:superfamily II DNA/RNA helicase